LHIIRQINPVLKLGVLDLAAFNKNSGSQNKRELETSGIRYLLDKFFENETWSLEYTKAKKPYLKGRPEHISISHSHDKLAITCNTEQNTGVDIELIREKVLNIRQKFLNTEELAFAGNHTETLTGLWAAKEAIYKAYGLKEVDFRENISVAPWNDEENSFTGKIDLPTFKKTYLLAREKQDNYILVYIISEV
jgi:4'-phosphopantetheinyl transferase